MQTHLAPHNESSLHCMGASHTNAGSCLPLAIMCLHFAGGMRELGAVPDQPWIPRASFPCFLLLTGLWAWSTFQVWVKGVFDIHACTHARAREQFFSLLFAQAKISILKLERNGKPTTSKSRNWPYPIHSGRQKIYNKEQTHYKEMDLIFVKWVTASNKSHWFIPVSSSLWRSLIEV